MTAHGAPRYDAGQLDQRVAFVRNTVTPNDTGTLVEAPATIAEVWAHVRPTRGGENDRGSQTEERRDHLVVIRYRSDLLESDDLIWRHPAGDLSMNIRNIHDRGARYQWLEIEAELGAP